MISGSAIPRVKVARDKKKKAKKFLYYHVFQIDYGYGWRDELVSVDWGECHKLKEECIEAYSPSFNYKFRIIQRRIEVKPKRSFFSNEK